MKFVNMLLGRDSNPNPILTEMANEMASPLGTTPQINNQPGTARTDENGKIWLHDVDADEKSNNYKGGGN